MVTHSPDNASFSSRIVNLLDGQDRLGQADGALAMSNYLHVLLRNLQAREALRRDQHRRALARHRLLPDPGPVPAQRTDLRPALREPRAHLPRRVNEFTDRRQPVTSSRSPRASSVRCSRPNTRTTCRTTSASRATPTEGGVAIRHGDDVFYWENSYFADDNVFDVFPVEVIYGDPKTALVEQRVHRDQPDRSPGSTSATRIRSARRSPRTAACHRRSRWCSRTSRQNTHLQVRHPLVRQPAVPARLGQSVAAPAAALRASATSPTC